MERHVIVVDALLKAERRYHSRLNAKKTCLHLKYEPLEFGGVKFDANEEGFNDFLDTLSMYCELEELYIDHDGINQIPSKISLFENLNVLSLKGSRIGTIDLKRIPACVKSLTISPNGGEIIQQDVMWNLRHLPNSIEYLKLPGCGAHEHDWPVLKYFENLLEIDLSEDHPYHYEYDADGNQIDYEHDVLKPWLKKYKSWKFDADTSRVRILRESWQAYSFVQKNQTCHLLHHS